MKISKIEIQRILVREVDERVDVPPVGEHIRLDDPVGWHGGAIDLFFCGMDPSGSIVRWHLTNQLFGESNGLSGSFFWAGRCVLECCGIIWRASALFRLRPIGNRCSRSLYTLSTIQTQILVVLGEKIINFLIFRCLRSHFEGKLHDSPSIFYK
jgi:hypothetical protein